MPRTLWSCCAVVGVVGTAVYPALPLTWQAVLYAASGLTCVVAVLVGVRLWRPARLAPWYLIAAGFGFFVAGDLGYAAYDVLQGGPPFPSIADGLYLAGYPTLIAAMAVVVRRSGARDSVAWQEAAIWVMGTTLLAWEGLIEPTSTTPGATVAARLVALAVPVLDLVVLLLVLRLLAGHRASRVYWALTGAIGLYLVTDTVSGVQALAGTYVSGDPLDVGWVLSYFAIGALALHPRMVDLTEPPVVPSAPRSRLRLLTLAAAALLAPGRLAWQSVFGDHVDGLAISVAAAVLFVLTAARGLGLLASLERLTDQLRSRERELHQQATRDALTELPNRRALSEELERRLGTGEQFCVAVLDLDGFKTVNDARGHDAGDALLQEVARRLSAVARDDELPLRLGGDEFAFVSATPALDLVDRLLHGLQGPQHAGAPDVRASLGVTSSDLSRTSSELLRHADLAMYAAKSGGGARYAVYRPELSADLLRRLQVETDLRQGVADEQVVPWFQPVVDLGSGRLTGFEALARWERPGRAIAPPAEWMALAEETGLVVAVDALVLRAAVRQLVTWSRLHPEAAGLHVRGAHRPGRAPSAEGAPAGGAARLVTVGRPGRPPTVHLQPLDAGRRRRSVLRATRWRRRTDERAVQRGGVPGRPARRGRGRRPGRAGVR